MYLFFMDRGSYLRVELKFKFNSARALMEHLESIPNGIPIPNQILLISGGHVIDSNSILQDYDAGDSESNPIYVFNRECFKPGYQVQLETYAIQDDDVDSRICQLLELRPTQHAVLERARFMVQLRNLFHELQDGILTLIREQHAMVQGWCVALANVDEVVRGFRARFGRMRHVTKHIQQQELLWSDCFHRISKIREILERIPVLNSLIPELQQQLGTSKFPWPDEREEEAKGAKDETMTPSVKPLPVMNLYQWILLRSQGHSANSTVSVTNAGTPLSTTTTTLSQSTPHLQPLLSTPSPSVSAPRLSGRRDRCASVSSPGPMLGVNGTPEQPTSTCPGLDLGSYVPSGLETSPLFSHTGLQRNWFDESQRALEIIQSSLPSRLGEIFEKLLSLGTDSSQNSRLDTEPLAERLQSLAMLPDKARVHVTRVDSCCEVIQRNAQQLGATVSLDVTTASNVGPPPFSTSSVSAGGIPVSVLQDMCANHVEMLREVRDRYRALMAIVQQCNHSKCELSQVICENQRWMSAYQQDVCRNMARIKKLSGCCQVLDRFALVVQQMESAPRLYVRCLREIVRRREMFSCVERWAQQVLAFDPVLEAQQRESLVFELKSHFLHSIFARITDAGAEDGHGGLLLRTHPDRHLPVVTRADLRYLESLVPELANDLFLPKKYDNSASNRDKDPGNTFQQMEESLPYDKELISMGVGDTMVWTDHRPSRSESPCGGVILVSYQEVSCQTGDCSEKNESVTSTTSSSSLLRAVLISQSTSNSSSSAVAPMSTSNEKDHHLDSSKTKMSGEGRAHENLPYGKEDMSTTQYGCWQSTTSKCADALLESDLFPIPSPLSSQDSPVHFMSNVNRGGHMVESFHTTQEQISPTHSVSAVHPHDEEILQRRLQMSCETQTDDTFPSPELMEAVQQLYETDPDLHNSTHDSSNDLVATQSHMSAWLLQLVERAQKQQEKHSVDQEIQLDPFLFKCDVEAQTDLEWIERLQQLQQEIVKCREENEILKSASDLRERELQRLLEERVSEGEHLRAQHARIVSQLKCSLEEARETALNEQCGTLSEQWNKEKREMTHRFDIMINEKALELQGTIDSLSEKNMELTRQLCDLKLQQMRDRDLIRKLKPELQSTLSLSPPNCHTVGNSPVIASGDAADNFALERTITSSTVMPGSIYRPEQVDLAGSGAFGTVLSSSVMDASTNPNSLARLTLHGRVLKFVHHNFKNGDVVAFVPIRCSSGDQWRMLSTDGELYFLHDSCYDILAQAIAYFNTPTQPSNSQGPSQSEIEDGGSGSFHSGSLTSSSPTTNVLSVAAPLSCRRDLLRLAVFVTKEKCQSKKAENRFDLPRDHLFYRVRIRSRTPLDTAKQ